jgi:hypothetical protein
MLDPNLALTIAAVATAVYAFLTFLLLVESQNARREAQVAVYPTVFSESGLYLQLTAENYGPATAANVIVTFRLRDRQGDAITASERRQAEPVWGPGVGRKFLPRPEDGKLLSLGELGDAGMSLEIEWGWEDRRMSLIGLLRRQPARQDFKKTYGLAQLRDDMYGGSALVDPNPIAALPQIRDEIKALKASVKDIHSLMNGPAMRLYVESLTNEAGKTTKARGPRKAVAAKPRGGPNGNRGPG